MSSNRRMWRLSLSFSPGTKTDGPETSIRPRPELHRWEGRETNGRRRLIPHSSRTFELLGGIARVSRSNLAQENRQKQCAEKGTDRREGNVDGWRRPYWV
ncbi:hypothetical protein SCLCIDRAFT_1220387 [Scleroderma citrinum Foug A]|uniref:Uncharacterized protein n=1 Tax=Scleroderma citrinum Foug A TaxID=1036808 RepID=A0A0C3DJU4_9AGAM|nr:hypothetical protein SCLCIDRAFT_1220387 [Scleroderma citrinum Foug A]